MASVAWRLKSDSVSRPQPRGLRKLPCNNTVAVGLSVFGELGGKLGQDKKMKRHVKRQFITVQAWDVTYKILHKALGSYFDTTPQW